MFRLIITTTTTTASTITVTITITTTIIIIIIFNRRLHKIVVATQSAVNILLKDRGEPLV